MLRKDYGKQHEYHTANTLKKRANQAQTLDHSASNTASIGDDTIVRLTVGRMNHDVRISTLRRAGNMSPLYAMTLWNDALSAPPRTDDDRILLEGDGATFDHIRNW